MKYNRSQQPYRWQRAYWQQLQTQIAHDRLPHALLLHGQRGMGKREFADALIASVCCTQLQTDQLACGHCHGCSSLKNGCHPDVHQIIAEEEGGAISIDQIRALPNFVAQSRVNARYKMVLIDTCDRMNHAASNALLKTLEEPTPDTILVLVTDRAEQLSATIRSRCCSIYFAPLTSFNETLVDIEEVKDNNELCALSFGAPLCAVQWLEQESLNTQREQLFTQLEQLLQHASVVSVTQQLSAIEPVNFLQWFQSVISDVLRVQQQFPITALTHRDQLTRLQTFAAQLDVRRLFVVLDEINQTLQTVLRQRNLNFQLCCETMFSQWKQCRMKGEG